VAPADARVGCVDSVIAHLQGNPARPANGVGRKKQISALNRGFDTLQDRSRERLRSRRRRCHVEKRGGGDGCRCSGCAGRGGRWSALPRQALPGGVATPAVVCASSLVGTWPSAARPPVRAMRWF